MNKDNELIIDGEPYSNLQLYTICLSDITAGDMVSKIEGATPEEIKKIIDFFKKFEAKPRPCVLLQASNVGENFGNTTKFIAIPFSTKYNYTDRNFKDYIVTLTLSKTDSSYAKPFKFETTSDKLSVDTKRWYNKETGEYECITTEQLKQIVDTFDNYIRGVVNMNLDFHNMPSQHAIMEKAIQDLEDSNKDLQASNKDLQASNQKLECSYNEVKLSNRELQASNKDLQASNKDLQASNKSLENKLNSSLSHLETIILNQSKQIDELANQLKLNS